MSSLALHHLTLRVSDLRRSVDFYAGRLGFAVLDQDATTAVLGTSADSTRLLT
jgi:catechol 2,3-dioxygenase-like lactoylglutathione lyase family enzyme